MDLTLPGQTSWVDLDVIFRTSYSQWPATVIAATGLPAQRLVYACYETFAAHVAPLQYFALYEGDAAYHFWRQFGQTQEFESSVIFVELHPSRIKLTVDRDGSNSFHVASTALAAVAQHRDNQANSNFWLRNSWTHTGHK